MGAGMGAGRGWGGVKGGMQNIYLITMTVALEPKFT